MLPSSLPDERDETIFFDIQMELVKPDLKLMNGSLQRPPFNQQPRILRGPSVARTRRGIGLRVFVVSSVEARPLAARRTRPQLRFGHVLCATPKGADPRRIERQGRAKH